MSYLCHNCWRPNNRPFCSNDACRVAMCTPIPELLMLDIQSPCEQVPIIDHYTKALTYGWRNCRSQSDPWHSYKGKHFSFCGLVSDNHDHWINGILTNSLCIHYMAFHRYECVERDLNFIAYWFPENDQECYPTEAELWPAYFDKAQSRVICTGELK